MPAPDARIVRRTAASASELPPDIHPLLRRVLANRAITRPEQMDHSLSRLADPFLMKDMHKAVERLCLALEKKQQIVIVGDFDADGATSSALMTLALDAMGFMPPNFVVPNRFEYGYGLSEAIVDEIAWQKPDLLITVDNGISSIAGVAHANALGMDVIVTDHHLPGEQLPPACAILNPNQPDCDFPGKSLAGVGVAFYFLVALRKVLREKGHFSKDNPEPNLADYLDIVALGTVADVVPLDFYNRLLVSQGLRRIRAGKMRPGIRQLLQIAGKDHRFIACSDLAFALAPRLNAAGRLDDMSQGIMLLISDSQELVAELAQSLDDFNRDRRAIEQQMQNEALAIVDQMIQQWQQPPRGFCLFHPDWHQGVVGLVASRLKERFHRPVIAFASTDSGELKGSGRSIDGIHLRDLLDSLATTNPGLLYKFGGHAMAAGLSLAPEQLPQFEKAFAEQLLGCDDALFEAVIETDGEVAADDLNLYTAQVLRDALPWGQKMPEPLFEGEFVLKASKVLAEKHLKLRLSLADNENSHSELDAIWFNADLDNFAQREGQQIYLVYRMDINHFRGEKSLQLLVETLRW